MDTDKRQEFVKEIDDMYTPTEQQMTLLERNFTYHAPKTSQAQRHSLIRDQAKALAAQLNLQCPVSRELSLAMTKLEEAVMWANAAIARNE